MTIAQTLDWMRSEITPTTLEITWTFGRVTVKAKQTNKRILWYVNGINLAFSALADFVAANQ